MSDTKVLDALTVLKLIWKLNHPINFNHKQHDYWTVQLIT